MEYQKYCIQFTYKLSNNQIIINKIMQTDQQTIVRSIKSKNVQLSAFYQPSKPYTPTIKITNHQHWRKNNHINYSTVNKNMNRHSKISKSKQQNISKFQSVHKNIQQQTISKSYKNQIIGSNKKHKNSNIILSKQIQSLHNNKQQQKPIKLLTEKKQTTRLSTIQLNGEELTHFPNSCGQFRKQKPNLQNNCLKGFKLTYPKQITTKIKVHQSSCIMLTPQKQTAHRKCQTSSLNRKSRIHSPNTPLKNRIKYPPHLNFDIFSKIEQNQGQSNIAGNQSCNQLCMNKNNYVYSNNAKIYQQFIMNCKPINIYKRARTPASGITNNRHYPLKSSRNYKNLYNQTQKNDQIAFADK